MENERTSEEKNLPASSRKLRHLRKKGYVPRSQEMVAAVVMAIAFVYLILQGQKFFEGYQTAIEEISRQTTDDITIAAYQVFKSVIMGIGVLLAVLYGLVIITTIIINIISNGGFIFSLNHLKFNISNLNPLSGLKRILSLRTVIDLSRRIVTIIVFSILTTILISNFLNEPFYIPSCGLYCFQGVMKYITGMLLSVAVLLLLFAGLFDLNIQRWLFQRQHRMTRSEAKRDRKEDEGSPEVQSYRRRLRQGVLQISKVYGPADATIMIEGSDLIVGLRFIRGETLLPIIVCKGKGLHLLEISGIALDNKIPKCFDEELAFGLYRSHEPGGRLADIYFAPFIKALKAVNLI